MPDYMVGRPLDQDPLQMYSCTGYALEDSVLVLGAEDARAAALAVMTEKALCPGRWVTLGPEGITRLDFSVPEGFETLSLEPGPHR